MKTEQRDGVRNISGADAMTYADSRIGKGRGFCFEGDLPTETLERLHAVAADTFGRAAIEFDRADETTISGWGYLLRASALLLEVVEVVEATSENASLLEHRLRAAQDAAIVRCWELDVPGLR
jgi:hypothetical protein